MIDTAELWVTAGGGGDGCVSFRREKFVPRGGPDGGDGGTGGSVYLYVDSGRNTLSHLRNEREKRGGDGGNGRGRKKHGRDGRSVWIPVAVGTRVEKNSGGHSETIDLVEEGQIWPGAHGGGGGRGNVEFASATNRTPLVAEAGEPGERAHLRLELLLLADVALIGLPNAGKSTLLTQISHARAKIAAYPFTTLDPVLGSVDVAGKNFVAVEIPGLIEGSHLGVGLGDQFLKHAERTRVFIHVVDAAAVEPTQAYRQVQWELEQFSPGLGLRPTIVAANKVDLPGTQGALRQLKREIGTSVQAVVPISAKTGQGAANLLNKVVSLLESAPKELEIGIVGKEIQQKQNKKSKEPPRQIQTRRSSEGAIHIDAPEAERLVRGTNLKEWRAKVQLWQQLRRLGVVKALEEAGAGPGSLVRFGDTEMEWL